MLNYTKNNCTAASTNYSKKQQEAKKKKNYNNCYYKKIKKDLNGKRSKINKKQQRKTRPNTGEPNKLNLEQ